MFGVAKTMPSMCPLDRAFLTTTIDDVWCLSSSTGTCADLADDSRWCVDVAKKEAVLLPHCG